MTTHTSCEVDTSRNPDGHLVVAIRLFSDRTEIQLAPRDALRLTDQLTDAVLHGGGADVHIDLDEDHGIVVAPAEAQRLRIELERCARIALQEG